MNEGNNDGPKQILEGIHVDDHDDHQEEEVQAKIWTFAVFVASVPLMYLGYTKAAMCFIAIGILYIFVGQESGALKPLSVKDQYAARYNTFTADDIVRDMQQWHIRFNHSRLAPEKSKRDASTRLFQDILLLGLSTLTKRYGIIQQNQKKQTSTASNHLTQLAEESEVQSLACSCQDAVHVCLQSSNSLCNENVVSSSFALLALVSRNEEVRQRYLVPNDSSSDQDIQYQIKDVVETIHLALKRGNDYNDELKEQIAAEVQRKACLLLGALSDGNTLMAQHIGQSGGIQCILDAISWYRCHNDVTCWGLWALFILCYENYMNKVILVQLDGIPIILEVMKQCPDSMEVARHGTAILFDCLREESPSLPGGNTACSTDSRMDVWKIRNVALSSGLHDRILHVLRQFSGGTNMDIYMMGREILLGTNYQGPLPEPQMALIPSPQR